MRVAATCDEASLRDTEDNMMDDGGGLPFYDDLVKSELIGLTLLTSMTETTTVGWS